uniref:Internal head protein n=1 Tax=Pseudomonas phage RVTF4 TaxID=3236931 RepID=A0AB39CD09_9VIRU
MLKLSAYLPSMEDHDELPSPLMDGDAVPAAVLPGDDLGEVAVVPELAPEVAVPVEDVVELPPHLDPTPMAPLEGEVIQEEIISEHLDTEAGQLLGAQIAMEGYSKLLRSAGKNMTRQSAAFMAVGMRRATRLVPGLALGMEDESSGTQVMAMQQAKVDEKGLGAKIKEAGAKIWEWIKAKFARFAEWLKSLVANKEKTKAETVYLIAATKAVETGNPGPVKNLEAPQGVKVSQVLDAIHGEDVRAPKAGKTVKLPAKFAPFLTKDGKLDLNLAVENEVRSKILHDYLRDGTAFVRGIIDIFKSATKDISAEEVGDRMSDLKKKHLGGKAGKWELHGMTVTLSDDGTMTAEETSVEGEVEVQVPSPQEIRRYLEDVNKVLNSDDDAGIKIAEEFNKAGEDMMRLEGVPADQIPKENMRAIEQAIGKVMNGQSFDSVIIKIGRHLDKMATVATKAADFFLASLLGKGNTISQEDFERLPSKGLAVIPQGPGPSRFQRGVTMAKEAWRKLREFFQRLWDQFSAWCQKLWAKIRGTEADTDVLLLTNDAAPDEAGGAPGQIPQLPTGTRMKSVQAVRLLGGPAAAPGETPAAVSEEPSVIIPPAPPAGVPAGSIQVPEALEIMVGNGIEAEPVWEETMLNWLLRHYIPTQEKIVRDLTSWAGTSNFDGGIMEWSGLVENATEQLWKGMPTDNVPGQRTIAPGKGCKIQVRQEGMMGEAPVVKILKRRQIDQALSRQKKLLKGIAGIEKFRIAAERQRASLNAILDKRVAAGAEESAVTQFYNNLEQNIIQSSAAVVAGVITKMCDARNAVFDAMIAARARK